MTDSPESPLPDTSLGRGVYYEDDDYAGFVQRALALSIDFVVLVFIGGLIFVLLEAIGGWESERGFVRVFWPTFGVWAWLYLAVLKRSSVRTLGYRITGLRVVNLRGERPSIIRMTFRFLLWVAGPFHLLFDLLWQGADSEKQTLRDCFSGTYVVQCAAAPAGEGWLRLARYGSMGLTLTYPRVRRDS